MNNGSQFNDPRKTYVFEEDGKILGTYYIKTNQSGPGEHVCNCGYMVSSAARGRGLATAGYKAMQFNFVASSNAGAGRLNQIADQIFFGKVFRKK